MSNYAVLDNVAHADLRVKIEYGEAFGDAVNQALVFPTEFQDLQREYPIFFRQSPEQKFYAVVLLGLDRNENLFLEGDRWNGRYIPAVQMKGPFAIGLRDGENPEQADPHIQIDLDNPKVSREDGQNLFLPQGGHSPYLEQVIKTLKRIHIGATVVDRFFAELQKFDLIEPITLEAKFSETEQYTVPDVFTISQSRMTELNGEELHELNKLGLLEHCFAVMASAGNMARIVDMKALKKAKAG